MGWERLHMNWCQVCEAVAEPFMDDPTAVHAPETGIRYADWGLRLAVREWERSGEMPEAWINRELDRRLRHMKEGRGAGESIVAD